MGWTRHLTTYTYPADALLRPAIAIYKGRVRCPRAGRLVFQPLASVSNADSFLYLAVYGLLDTHLDMLQLRREGSHVLSVQ